MKNFMKKIIIASFVFAMLLVVSQNAIAATVWNGASNDCLGIAIANQTKNTGIVVPCWPLKTVSSNDGDSINIRIYYHNTSGQNATNVKFKLNAPIGASSSHTFSGQIISDQGNLSLGNVTVNTPSGSTVDFSSAHWLPNQNQTESPMPFGQSLKGTEILGDGLIIGTVASSWDTQGSVVIAFSVNSPVNPPVNVPTGTLTPNKTSCSISVGQNSCNINFSWNTNDPVGTSAVTRDGGSTVATGNSGTKAFTIPYNSATFRLYNDAIELDSKTVSSYCTTGSSWNGSACAQNVNPTDSCSITSFTVGGALSSTVSLGNGVELAWTTTGCDSVNIANVGSNLNTNDIKTVYPSVSTSYTATAIGSSGNASPRTVSVTVNNVANPNYNCSISSFTIGESSSDTVFLGDSTELAWATTNCNYVTITDVGSSLLANDNYTIYPNISKTYRLTAYGSSGSNPTRTVSITVKPVANPTYTCSISNFTANSSRSITVVENSNVNILWDTSNCTYVNIQGVGSNLTSSGNYTVNPSRNTRYTIIASGSTGGTQTRYVDVTVTRGITPTYYANVTPYIIPTPTPIPTPIYNNCAVTTVATNINQTVVQLNGIITSPVGANTYFEYGPTVGLGYRTNSRYINGNTNFTEIVSNLTPNTIYFFRMVSNCQNGTSLGAIEVFKTLAIPTANVVTTRPIIIQGPTVSSSESPIILKIENKYQTIKIGDIIDYVVTYKNIGNSKLTNPMVQVFIPQGLTLTNYSRGTYLENDRTLSVPIEDLNPKIDGVIYLQARVDNIDSSLAQVVTTTILIYTNPKGAQENAMAYVLNNPTFNNLLGASASASNFLGLNLIGWLLIIILIMLLILIARSLYNRRSVETTTTHKTIN